VPFEQFFTRRGEADFDGLPPVRRRKAERVLRLLADNPRHPSLNTHIYHGYKNPFDADKPVFEAYLENRTPGAYRIFWCYGPKKDQLTVIAITPHP